MLCTGIWDRVTFWGEWLEWPQLVSCRFLTAVTPPIQSKVTRQLVRCRFLTAVTTLPHTGIVDRHHRPYNLLILNSTMKLLTKLTDHWHRTQVGTAVSRPAWIILLRSCYELLDSPQAISTTSQIPYISPNTTEVCINAVFTKSGIYGLTIIYRQLYIYITDNCRLSFV